MVWTLIKYLELITLLLGIFYYKKYFDTYLKYFLFLLGLVVFVEFSIWGLRQFYDITFQNNFIYNVLTSLQYVYYFALYRKVFIGEREKKIASVFLYVFLFSVVINFIFIQKFTVDGPFHSYSFTLGAVLLIITIGLFFAEILRTEKVLIFRSNLMFWISTGLFVFYTAIIPVILSVNFLPKGLAPDTYSAILFALNFMMYTCFSIGFIVSDRYHT